MARGTGTRDYIRRKKLTPLRVIFAFFAVLVVLALILFALSPFLADSVKSESGAMSPSIGITDTVGVNHLAYLLLPPARGDIILFRTARGESGTSYSREPASIRRIVGLPGETVQIMDGRVYINGRPLKEDYLSGEMTYGGTAASALTLGNDEYFVMADNRSNNFDSRDSTVGPVPATDIIGKAWLRIKTLEKFGMI